MSAMTQRRFIYTAYRLGCQQNAKRLIAIALHPQFDAMQRIDTLRLLAIWTNPHELDRHLLAAITKLQKSNILGEAIEILNAASKSENKKITAAFKAYTLAIGADLQKKFNVSLLGGDALNGKSLFTSHPAAACTRCHSIGKNGGNAGPNLEGIASVIDRKTILESLIDPSARIAPGFGNVSIITKQKKTLTGMFLGEKNGVIKLKVGNDIMKIKLDEVSTLNKLPSSMPPMHLLLKEREVRDIVAFIDSLKQNKKTPGAKSH